MIFLSTVLACLLIGSGLSAVFLGSGMIVLERGWSMVISGSVVATGGVLLLGIAMLIRELRRLPDRIADVLPEALPSHLLYAAEDAASSPADTADAHAARRPRIDPVVATPPELDPEPEPAAPGETDSRETDSRATDSLVEAPEAPWTPPSFETGSGTPAGDRSDATGSSALKIQISLHGNGRQDARPDTGGAPAAIAPTVRDTGGDAARQPRSFWSRLGRGEKPVPEKEPDPVVEDAPALPPGPTAAERARERLALADTPEPPIDAAARADLPDAAPDRPLPDKTEPDDGDSPAASADRTDWQGAPPPPAPDDGASPGGDAAPQQPAETGREEAGREESGRRETGRADVADAGEPKAASARPEPDETVPPRPTGEGAPAIVGSYRAAGNLYVMFDDGAIEAETPLGIFRFASLDKLKAYIASGEDPALAGPRVDRPATDTDAQAAAAPGAEHKAAS